MHLIIKTTNNNFFSYALPLLLVLLFTSCISSAQISGRLEEIGGKPYYIHTVEKGQTLYSLSKLYNCDINAITAANPGTDAGIQVGSQIRIPAASAKVKGQSIADSNGDRKYLLHVVQKKETLYSISNQYNIDINDLVAANPGSDQGLKKGQELRIPIKQEKPRVVPSDKITHTVKPGETLFGIARQYGVGAEDIQNANDGLKRGLLAGEDIFIPVNIGPQGPEISVDNKTIRSIEIKGSETEDHYEIGLLLPFYVTYNDTMESRENRMRDVALQMYRGAMMAADTLEKSGLNATLYVYDIIDSKSMVTEMLERKEMKEMDLLIGPLFRETIADVGVWADKNGTHLVIPVQQPNKVLLSSSNMSKTVPGAATQWITIARHLYKKYPNENIIVIDSKNIDDRRSVDAFREEWKKLNGDSLSKIIVVADVGNFQTKDKYVSGKKNIIIAPTADKKLIGTLFRVLGDGDIEVWGNETWDDLEAISVANRNKYKVHFPQTIFVDYGSLRVQKWIEAYRKKYNQEPGKFAFVGFDVMMQYGSGLLQFGRSFPNHLNEIETRLYATGYDFFKTSNESGFENQYVIIVGTNNFELIREN
jgi:LysM repeat protein/ABC-type branched-subunit amino acid transport system substrate-binding protein